MINRNFTQLTCVLTRPEKGETQWSAWCPELDVCTCGDHSENAAAMLCDAIREVVSDALSSGNWEKHPAPATDDEDFFFKRKRVVHPTRLGKLACEDERWPEFQDYKDDKNGWGDTALIDFDKLDSGTEKIAFVTGFFEWTVRAGVVQIGIVEFHDSSVEVKGLRFRANIVQKLEKEYTQFASVRASEILPNMSLKEKYDVMSKNVSLYLDDGSDKIESIEIDGVDVNASTLLSAVGCCGLE